MNHETYERLSMDVTPFDAEDIITTSGTGFVPVSKSFPFLPESDFKNRHIKIP